MNERFPMSLSARRPLLTLQAQGLYCEAGDFFVDPWRPVDRAVITHAHADHARSGHRHYLAAAPGAASRLRVVTWVRAPQALGDSEIGRVRAVFMFAA